MGNEQALLAALAVVCTILLIATLSYRSAYLRSRGAHSRAPGFVAGTRRHICLVIGLGGSGKTSLVERLTADPNARSDVKTSNFRVYKTVIGRPQKGWFGRTKMTDRCTLYITDYNGQRFDLLFGSLFMAQKEPEFPVRYGYIDSIVFIADLFPPPQLSGGKPSTETSELNSRVNRNLQFFSTSMIDAVMGLTDKSLKCVCLFINKCDLMPDAGLTETSRREIEARFKPVITYLNNYSEGRVVSTVLGSAKTGMGVDDLRHRLIDVVMRPPPGTAREQA